MVGGVRGSVTAAATLRGTVSETVAAVTRADLDEVREALAGKQDRLTMGTDMEISDDSVISVVEYGTGEIGSLLEI